MSENKRNDNVTEFHKGGVKHNKIGKKYYLCILIPIIGIFCLLFMLYSEYVNTTYNGSVTINSFQISSNDFTIKDMQKVTPLVFEDISKDVLHTGEYFSYDFISYDKLEGYDDLDKGVKGYFNVEHQGPYDDIRFFNGKIRSIHLYIDEYSENKITINNTLVKDITIDFLVNHDPAVNTIIKRFNPYEKDKIIIEKVYSNDITVIYHIYNEKIFEIVVNFDD